MQSPSLQNITKCICTLHYTLLKDSHQEISMIGLHLLRARNTLYSLFVFKLHFFQCSLKNQPVKHSEESTINVCDISPVSEVHSQGSTSSLGSRPLDVEAAECSYSELQPLLANHREHGARVHQLLPLSQENRSCVY